MVTEIDVQPVAMKLRDALSKTTELHKIMEKEVKEVNVEDEEVYSNLVFKMNSLISTEILIKRALERIKSAFPNMLDAAS